MECEQKKKKLEDLTGGEKELEGREQEKEKEEKGEMQQNVET